MSLCPCLCVCVSVCVCARLFVDCVCLCLCVFVCVIPSFFPPQGNLLQTQTTSELSSFLSSNPLIQPPTNLSNPPASVSSSSITELSQLNGNSVQRFIIRPGGLVEGGGLSTLSQQSPIGLPSLVESSITHELNPASTGFSAGLNNTIGPSGIIFDDSSTDDTN